VSRAIIDVGNEVARQAGHERCLGRRVARTYVVDPPLALSQVHNLNRRPRSA
jgi:hypothetical protein